MSGMGTDADLMHKASGQVDEVRNNIENAVKKLHGNIEPVMAGWQGDAAQVFRRLMEQFQQDADKINQKLGEISENIQSSGKQYTEQESEHSQDLSKIEGMLGN